MGCNTECSSSWNWLAGKMLPIALQMYIKTSQQEVIIGPQPILTVFYLPRYFLMEKEYIAKC